MTSLGVGAAEYPGVLLDRLGDAAPGVLHTRGDLGLLRRTLMALFCSERVAPDLVLPALELSVHHDEARRAVVSGFHSRVEREFLRLLVEVGRPAVVWLAREIHAFRMPHDWRRAADAGTLLVASGCGRDLRRPTARSAEERNRAVAAVAEQALFVGVSPGGRLHRLAREIAARGQAMSCFDHPTNEDLLLLGARPIPVGSYRTHPADAALSSASWT